MPNGQVGVAVDIVRGVLQALEGGDITLDSDRVSTSVFGCDRDACTWRERSVSIYEAEVRFITGFRRARLELFVRFEYDGCDVNDARLVLGRSSFIGFLSGAEFGVTARAGASKLRGPSGCEDCCPQSACVNFDVTVASDAALTVGTGTDPFSIRVCGDGSVKFV